MARDGPLGHLWDHRAHCLPGSPQILAQPSLAAPTMAQAGAGTAPPVAPEGVCGGLGGIHTVLTLQATVASTQISKDVADSLEAQAEAHHWGGATSESPAGQCPVEPRQGGGDCLQDPRTAGPPVTRRSLGERQAGDSNPRTLSGLSPAKPWGPSPVPVCLEGGQGVQDHPLFMSPMSPVPLENADSYDFVCDGGSTGPRMQCCGWNACIL